jgi:hypothetical protein
VVGGGGLRVQQVSGRVVDMRVVARLLEGSAVRVRSWSRGESAEGQRERRLLARCRRVGVEPSDVLGAFEGQSGGCGVCGVVRSLGELRFDVVGGVLRGLVCSRCEAGLRYFGSPDLAAGALGYLGGGAEG